MCITKIAGDEAVSVEHTDQFWKVRELVWTPVHTRLLSWDSLVSGEQQSPFLRPVDPILSFVFVVLTSQTEDNNSNSRNNDFNPLLFWFINTFML